MKRQTKFVYNEDKNDDDDYDDDDDDNDDYDEKTVKKRRADNFKRFNGNNNNGGGSSSSSKERETVCKNQLVRFKNEKFKILEIPLFSNFLNTLLCVAYSAYETYPAGQKRYCILNVIKYICEINNVLVHINELVELDFSILYEPGVLVKTSNGGPFTYRLALSTFIIDALNNNKPKINIYFKNQLIPNNITSINSEYLYDDSIVEVCNYIICADHIAMHHIQSILSNREPDYQNHSDFIDSDAFTLHNKIEISSAPASLFNVNKNTFNSPTIFS